MSSKKEIYEEITEVLRFIGWNSYLGHCNSYGMEQRAHFGALLIGVDLILLGNRVLSVLWGLWGTKRVKMPFLGLKNEQKR